MQKIISGMIVTVALALTVVCAIAEDDKKNAVARPKAARHEQKGQRRKGAVTKKMTTPYRKTETKNYIVETPEGWEVGHETPFGQREIRPAKETEADRGASMSSMTGPGLGRQSWQQLYETSLSPISGRLFCVSSLARYMAIWRGRAMLAGRFLEYMSATLIL